jgi:succinyldiaminopimelate transaminase
VVQRALKAASNAPGYPLTAGSVDLRQALVDWLHRRFGANVPLDGVLPVIGTKELVAALPTLLGAKLVGFPSLAYPTYEVGARYAGAQGIAVDSTVAVGPRRLDLLWLNSPSNPTGQVLPAEHLRKVVDWGRERGTVIASDECYADVYYGDEPPSSVLSPTVCKDKLKGLLAVHSLSKRSNMAGFRAGFVAGDPELVSQLLEVRKHLGMMVPAPVQVAMVAALGDDRHAATQRKRYAARRSRLMAALSATGFTVDHSDAGLYLWASRGENCWKTVDRLANEYGILVAPGEFYGKAGRKHVRIALTATDERIAAACARLTGG